MSLVKIVLHIGAHKTGSTFLQQWLSLNRQRLLRHGIVVPPSSNMAHDVALMIHDDLKASREAHPSRAQLSSQGNALDEIGSLKIDAESSCIISSERFATLSPDSIFRHFSDNGFEIEKVICFIRRQDRIQFSSYAQSVKRGSSAQKFRPSFDPEYLNWEVLYDSWAELVGAQKLRFHDYSYWASTNKLLEVFRASLDLPEDSATEIIPPDNASNHSLNAETTEMMRLANCLGWHEICNLLEALPGLATDRRQFASAKWAGEIEKLHLESNRRLAKRLGLKEFSDLVVSEWAVEGDDSTGTITTKTLEAFLLSVQAKMIELKLIFRDSTVFGALPTEITAPTPNLNDLRPLIAYGSQLGEPRAVIEEQERPPEYAEVPSEQVALFKILRRVAAVWSESDPQDHLKDKAKNHRQARLPANDENLDSSRDVGTLEPPAGSDSETALSGFSDGRRKYFSESSRIKKLVMLLIGGFDESYYLKTYPDLRIGGRDPLIHYLRHGWLEGRQKGPAKPEGRMRRLLRSILNPYVNASTNTPWYCSAPASHENVSPSATMRPPAAIKTLQIIAALVAGPILLRQFRNPPLRKKKKKSLVVVLHEGTQTGAPLIGYDLVVKALRDHNVAVMCLRPGPVADLCHQAGATVFCWRFLRCRRWLLGAATSYYVALRTKPDVAFINSVEARFVLAGLKSASIECVTLIHEFASYILPESDFSLAVKLSDHVVYPSTIVKNNANNLYPQLVTIPTSVIHQGLCTHVNDSRRKEQNSIDRLLGLNTLPSNSRIVVGVGHADYRKGLDLFVQTAAWVVKSKPEQPYHFRWVGGGFSPGVDQAYSAFVADQIRRHGLEDRIQFTGPVNDMISVYEKAHALLLTSRLDPMPNVAIEAMTCSVPVICFEGASGTAEYLASLNLSNPCVANYLDTRHMADLLLDLLADEQSRWQVADAVSKAASADFDNEEYYQRLMQLTQLDPTTQS